MYLYILANRQYRGVCIVNVINHSPLSLMRRDDIGTCVNKLTKMTSSIHSPEYKLVLAKLIEMRKEAGLTQRDLAQRLAREHSFVWRFETGKRRLDVVEFYWVCKALRRNAATVYRELMQEIVAIAPLRASGSSR